MTEKQAIALAESEFWKDMTLEDRAKFQLFQERLCMPFGVFHEAVEKLLGRGVWTHEFANQKALQQEYLGERKAPSMQEIIEMIPADKRVIVLVDK